MAFLVVADLQAFVPGINTTKAAQMIVDAEALAVLAAPCLAADADPALTAAQTAAVKAVLRGAILRWDEAGSGALQSQQAGPFGQTLDTRQTRRTMFWPTELEQLRDICGGTSGSGAFDIDTVPNGDEALIHNETCALNFGADYCSCGAVLTGNVPLYGGP